MTGSGRKIIFLTGAPLSSALRWDDQSLSAPMQACFWDDPEPSPIDQDSCSGPRWRVLPFEPEDSPALAATEHCKDDEAQQEKNVHRASVDGTTFLTTTDLSSFSNTSGRILSAQLYVSESQDDLLTQFYQHSFAAHQETQLDYDSSNESSSFSTSFGESYTAFEQQIASSPRNQLTRTRLFSARLTDLDHVPNAAYLNSINPQTMTVNIVVGVISIPVTRIIKSKWAGGRSMGLVEMLVGDDRKAGFGINLWVSSDPNNRKPALLETDLAHLRPQDIILARNVALGSFRGKVYGQSLQRDMTTLDLLYRNVIDASDTPGAFGVRELEDDDGKNDEDLIGGQLAKLRRVRRWVMEFVGGGIGAQQARGLGMSKGPGLLTRRPQLQALPADTQ